MNDKVKVECPHCGYVVPVRVSVLTPGMWFECLNCQQKFRLSYQDIQHLIAAIKHKK